ncbi:WD repeat and HMG-box DNA-binding protein 1-like isoform X2 [Ptychodera flava]|uniref:WD repeat and HMG-box DNA-binding protein 1-like isoform X2 n=1 Tax=Ptychodera flava TaxID=63121 RepID=UPI003969D2B2
MTAEMKSMRYGHSDGHTEVCYEDNGEHIVTCGSDGDLRIWQSIEDEYPQTLSVGNQTRTMVVKNGRVFTNSDSNTVQAFTFPEGSPDGIIMRFTAPVNHLCISSTGDLLLAGSDDFHVKLVKVDGSTQKIFLGHDAPILSVALDPENVFIASSSCDGSIKVWKIEDQTCVQTWNILARCSDLSISKTLCRLSFQPGKGKFLAVPVDKAIQVFQRDNWTKLYSLQDERIQQEMSLSAWSLDGKFVIGVSVDGGIYVWNWESKSCVQFVQHDKKLTICAIALHPKGKNEIVYTDTEGQLDVIKNLLPESVDQAKPSHSEITQSTEFEDDNHDDEDFLAAANAIELLHGNQDKTANFVHDEVDDGDDDDDDDIGTLVTQTPKHRSLLRIQDDENSLDSTSKGTSSIANDSDNERVVARKPSVYTSPQFVPLQKAFQPSSTPVHLSSRFMVWNSVGIIKAYSTEEENSIEVEFHDTSLHHAMHTDNTVGYTMGTMSTEAVVLAAESQDSETPSQLLCLHFSSWDNQKEWSITMPNGEDIKAITLGYGWLAVATDKRLVRLFSIGGLQREIISIPGPVVCLAGHGTQLLIIYHMATGIPGDQCLGVKLLSVYGQQKHIVSGDQLPISSQSTLVWLGFSAEGTPFSVDSNGIVRMLNRELMSWSPVANTRSKAKGRSDHYWIVGVHENPLQLRCIPCKGATFPPTLPRPAVTILEFQIPLCEMNTEKGKSEEEYWRNRSFSHHMKYNQSQGYELDKNEEKAAQQEINNALMKLFAISCKTDRDFRGGEVAEMMSSEHSISLAIKYASRMKKLSLAQYLSQLAKQKAEEESAAAMATENVVDDYYIYSNSSNAVHTETEWSTQKNFHSQTMKGDDSDDNGEDMEDDGSCSNQNFVKKSPILKPRKVSATRSQTSDRRLKNPFKISEKSETVPSSDAGGVKPKGSNIFDEMKKKMPNKATNKTVKITDTISCKTRLKKSQPALFQSKSKTTGDKKEHQESSEAPSKKPVSTFQFWLQQNKGKLAKEYPDMEEIKLMKLATQMWRSLSAEVKQGWSEKAKLATRTSVNTDQEDKTQKQTETETFEDKNQIAKKRKLEEENGTPKKKQTLARINGKSDKTKASLSSSTSDKLALFAFQKD